MQELTIAGHTPKVQDREVWIPAYGNSEQKSSRPWLVCNCGWERELFHSPSERHTAEIARLEHFMVVLDSQNCPDCHDGRYCAKHCPRANRHQNSRDQFCASCGLELSRR